MAEPEPESAPVERMASPLPPAFGYGDMAGCILFPVVGGALLLLALALAGAGTGPDDRDRRHRHRHRHEHNAVDVMFATMMIPHHQGAIDMAEVEIAPGRSPQTLALAAAIKAGQSAEIAQMQQLLSTL